jgi:excisionase family DNA binding protein
MINIDDFPALLTESEVQKLLRIGRGKAYDMIRAKEIPSRKLRGAIRIPRDELLRMLEQEPQQETRNSGAKLNTVPPAKEAMRSERAR